MAAALVLAATLAPAQTPSPRPSPPRRFVIDAHQHYEDKPDYFDRAREGLPAAQRDGLRADAHEALRGA